jgi:hypothetical protein
MRMPAVAVPAADAEQLGLVTPGFQDVELGPAVFRKARPTAALGKAPRYELMVSVATVTGIVGSLGFESAAVLFQNAAGVLVGDRLMFVTSCTSSEACGEIYLYRIGLRGPLDVVV